MVKKPLPKPTDAELGLLAVLWKRGPSTVREIHAALPDSTTGYTTTLKLLQNMTEKGLVVRDESQRSHIYAAAAAEEQTQRQLVGDLLRRAFRGSPASLVMQALTSKPATAEELAEIRRILDGLESKSRKGPKR